MAFLLFFFSFPEYACLLGCFHCNIFSIRISFDRLSWVKANTCIGNWIYTKMSAEDKKHKSLPTPTRICKNIIVLLLIYCSALYGHSFNSETLDKQSAAYLTRFLMNHYFFVVLTLGYGDEWICSSYCVLLSKGL